MSIRTFLNSCVLTLLLSSCSIFESSSLMEQDKLEENSAKNIEAPYVLMISIDGLRHDYLDKYKPKNLIQFSKEGVKAKSLKPVYPTLTFPNHYSIITGLRPDKHGIVANHFLAPDLENKEYSLRDRDSVINPDFYEGTPLWALARQQGMVSATYFWPGSEAPIDETYPSYWRKYEHNAPHSERIETVLNWLKLPKKTRPHFTTLYFSKVDSAGHAHGPDSKAVEKALDIVDKDLGLLLSELEKLDIPLNIIITSDHGMTDLSFSRVAYIDQNITSKKDQEAMDRFEVLSSFGIAFYYHKGPEEKKQSDIKKILPLLNQHPHFSTYKRGELPKHLHFNTNKRMGDLVSIAKNGWTIGLKRELRVIPGSHGFDPEETLDMDGIFMAKGPLLKKEKEIERFENIHIYPLVVELLGLEMKGNIDGDAKVLKPIMRK